MLASHYYEVFICFSFGSLEIFILALINTSFTAFCASALVWNASSSSIHGKVSSIFINAEYIRFRTPTISQNYFSDVND